MVLGLHVAEPPPFFGLFQRMIFTERFEIMAIPVWTSRPSAVLEELYFCGNNRFGSCPSGRVRSHWSFGKTNVL